MPKKFTIFSLLVICAITSIVLILTNSIWQSLLSMLLNLSRSDWDTVKLVLDIILGVITILSTLGSAITLIYRKITEKSSKAKREYEGKVILTSTSGQEILDAYIPNEVGRQLYWVNRGLIPNDLTSHHRVIILGKKGSGKTRETAEIVKRFSRQVGSKFVYRVPIQALDLPDDVLKAKITKELAETTKPLLYVENFPLQNLKRLSIFLSALNSYQGYIIITLRSENMEPSHRSWLQKNEYTILEIKGTGFDSKQVYNILMEIFARHGMRCSQEGLVLLQEHTFTYASPNDMIAFIADLQHQKKVDVDKVDVDIEDITTTLYTINQSRWQESYQKYPALESILVALETLKDANIPLRSLYVHDFSRYLYHQKRKLPSFFRAFGQAISYLEAAGHIQHKPGLFLAYDRKGSVQAEPKPDELIQFLNTYYGTTVIQTLGNLTPEELKLLPLDQFRPTTLELAHGYQFLKDQEYRKIIASLLFQLYRMVSIVMCAEDTSKDIEKVMVEVMAELGSGSAITVDISDKMAGVGNALLNEEYHQAANTFLEIQAQNKKDPFYSQICGDLFLTAGDQKKADEFWANAAKEFYDLGVKTREQGKLSISAVLFGKAAECKPDTANYQYEAGYSYLLLKDYERSIAAFRNAIEIAPTNPEYYSALTLALVSADDFTSALLYAHKAFQIAPEIYKYRTQWWAVLMMTGDYANLIEDYKKNYRQIERSYANLSLLGVAYMLKTTEQKPAQRDYSEAISILKEVTVSLPEDDFIKKTLADIYRINKQYDQAIEILKKLIANNPSTAIYHIELYHIYLSRMEKDRAAAELAAAEALIGSADNYDKACYAALKKEKKNLLDFLQSVLNDPKLSADEKVLVRLEARFDPDFDEYHNDPDFLAVITPNPIPGRKEK